MTWKFCIFPSVNILRDSQFLQSLHGTNECLCGIVQGRFALTVLAWKKNHGPVESRSSEPRNMGIF